MIVADAANTIVPCFLVLESQGYKISKRQDSEIEQWIAEKGDLQVLAEDPLRLLGLVTMVEARGEKWYAPDEEIEGFLQKFNLDV
jgi:hypothetical protein